MKATRHTASTLVEKFCGLAAHGIHACGESYGLAASGLVEKLRQRDLTKLSRPGSELISFGRGGCEDLLRTRGSKDSVRAGKGVEYIYYQ